MREVKRHLHDSNYSIVSGSDLDDLVRPSRYFNGDARVLRNLVERTGALLSGHFQLLNGQHSEYFIRFRNIATNYANVDEAANLLVETSSLEKGAKGCKVLCPDTAGSALATSFARHLDINTVIVAKTDERNRPTSLVNHSDIQFGDELVIVNDLSTTGEGLRELMILAQVEGGNIRGVYLFGSRVSDLEIFVKKIAPEAAVAYLVDFSLEEHTYGAKSNKRINDIQYHKDCPLCRNGIQTIPSWELN